MPPFLPKRVGMFGLSVSVQRPSRAVPGQRQTVSHRYKDTPFVMVLANKKKTLTATTITLTPTAHSNLFVTSRRRCRRRCRRRWWLCQSLGLLCGSLVMTLVEEMLGGESVTVPIAASGCPISCVRIRSGQNNTMSIQRICHVVVGC